MIYLGFKKGQSAVIVKKAPISYFLCLGLRLKYTGHYVFMSSNYARSQSYFACFDYCFYP